MISLHINLERIEAIQDAKSYWHKRLCPRGKCIPCDLRRIFRGKAFMCGHYDRRTRGYGKCAACYFAYLRHIPEQRERMNRASVAWRNRHREEVNQSERQRFYTDAAYRDSKRARDNESQKRRYHNNPDLRTQQWRRKYEARQRAKRQEAHP